MDVLPKAAAIQDVIGEQTDGDLDVRLLTLGQGGTQVEVVDVEGEVVGAGGSDGVEEGSEDLRVGGVAACGTFRTDAVAAEGAAHTTLNVRRRGWIRGLDLLPDHRKIQKLTGNSTLAGKSVTRIIHKTLSGLATTAPTL